MLAGRIVEVMWSKHVRHQPVSAATPNVVSVETDVEALRADALFKLNEVPELYLSSPSAFAKV
jgi:hypothetical protein